MRLSRRPETSGGAQPPWPCRSRFALAFAAAMIAATALANDLSVDKRTVAMDESLGITVTLTDDFAGVASVTIPLRNLELDGPPSSSSQFQWINGQSSKSKVLRYSAHPLQAGTAQIGPLRLQSSDGRIETLPPISVTVLADATAGSNDPARILHELLATGRDPIFLVAQADRSEGIAGDEVVVTWTLYNAASVEQYGIGGFPKLADFWSEELDVHGEQPENVTLGGVAVERLVMRRVALFPLRSGSLTVEPMTVNASVMKRVSRGDPFGMFEGMQVEVHRRSAPLTILVHPTPPGPPVDVVGSVAIRCGVPLQRNGGPVSIDVSLSGRANLRSAPSPHWESPIAGSVQIVERGVTVNRSPTDARMTRQWRYLIFPEREGEFQVPPLLSRTLTSEGVRQEVRCPARTLNVERPPVASESARPSRSRFANRAPDFPWPLVEGAALALLLSLALTRLWRRKRREGAAARALLHASPADTRTAVDGWLHSRGLDPSALMREGSDRGDAFRAVRSLLDAQESGRFAATERELGDRLRELLRAIGKGRAAGGEGG